MSKYLRVTKRGSIGITPKGNSRRYLDPGETIERSDAHAWFTKKEIDRLVDQGYLLRLAPDGDPSELPKPPALGEAHDNPLPSGDSRQDGKQTVPLLGVDNSDVSDGKHPKGRKQKGRVAVDAGPWNIDPASLAGKTLEDLNIRIAELHPTPEDIVVFDNTDDAIKFLSQDFS